jgi:hypothetical protein
MRTWLCAAVLGLGMTAASLAPDAGAAPRENRSSAAAEADEAVLSRLGYRPAPGARRLGRLYPSKAGEGIAFFEQQGREVSLVVVLRAGASARWVVPADSASLDVFWVGPSEIMLGSDLLAPKMRVKWSVAQAR